MVAIGGGMLMPREGTTPYHVEYAIKLSGKAAPRLCVLNQAVGDDPAYYLRFYDRLANSAAEVRHLSLFPMPNVEDPEDFLLSQDIIFVGGGSVANMVAVWRVHGIDQILRKAWNAGIVLAGRRPAASAGSRAGRRTPSAPGCAPTPTGSGCWRAASARTTTPSRSAAPSTSGWSPRAPSPAAWRATTASARTTSTTRWPR